MEEDLRALCRKAGEQAAGWRRMAPAAKPLRPRRQWGVALALTGLGTLALAALAVQFRDEPASAREAAAPASPAPIQPFHPPNPAPITETAVTSPTPPQAGAAPVPIPAPPAAPMGPVEIESQPDGSC